MLTSDKLSALDNMSMRVVNGDFKSCNKKGQRERCLINETNTCSTQISFHPISMIKIKNGP